MDIRTILEDPGAMVLPWPIHPAEWQGQTLEDILQAHPEEGAKLIERLVSDTDDTFHLILAAVMLAQKHGWEPFADNGRAKTKKVTAAPVGLTGAILKSAVASMKKAVNLKAFLPVLRCLLIEQTDETLVLASTNLETSLRLTLPFGGKPWKALVDVKVLETAIRAVGAGKTQKASLACDDDGKLHLSGARGNRVISGFPLDEFPSFPTDVAETVATIEGLALGRLAAVSKAAATRPERPVLTGVFVDPDQNETVAADGFRLALVSSIGIKVERPDGDDSATPLPSLLIPATAIKIAAQVMAGVEEMRCVRQGTNVSGTCVVFTGPAKSGGGQMEWATPLIEGHFPGYHGIIPSDEDLPVTFEVDTASALEAIEGLVPVSKSMRYITMFEANEGVLQMTVSGDNVSTQIVTVPITEQRGRTRWAAKSIFVADALEALKELGVNSPGAECAGASPRRTQRRARFRGWGFHPTLGQGECSAPLHPPGQTPPQGARLRLAVKTTTFKVGRVTFQAAFDGTGGEYLLPTGPFIVEGGDLTWTAMPMHISAQCQRKDVAPWEDQEAKLEYARQVARTHLVSEWSGLPRWQKHHETLDPLVEVMASLMVKKNTYTGLRLVRDEALKLKGQ